MAYATSVQAQIRINPIRKGELDIQSHLKKMELAAVLPPGNRKYVCSKRSAHGNSTKLPVEGYHNQNYPNIKNYLNWYFKRKKEHQGRHGRRGKLKKNLEG